MSLTRDNHVAVIDGIEVTIQGRTGPAHASWRLVVDGKTVDEVEACSGDCELQGKHPNGDDLRAEVKQSMVGPTVVRLFHNGAQARDFEGFVA